MLKLPNECLIGILNNLKYDHKSLFSCLLVNRRLCRVVIPILWSWLEISKNKKLIKTCLSALNAEEKALLISCGIVIPDIINPLLFEYLTYTTHVQIYSISGIEEFLHEFQYSTESHNLDNYFHYLNKFSMQNAAQTIKFTLIKLFLRISKNLQQLNILGNSLSYRPLGLVSFNPLDLEKVQALIMAFCKNTTVTSLTIEYIPLGSEAGKTFAKFLCNNTTLTRLFLANNQFTTNDGIVFTEALYDNTTLTHLSLTSNRLGIDGAKALAKVLYKNTALIYLNLENNQLVDEEVKDSEGGKVLATALSKNTTLRSLILCNNQLDSEIGRKFAETLDKNTTLISLRLTCSRHTIDIDTLNRIKELLKRNENKFNILFKDKVVNVVGGNGI
ncbi:RNI-like protein [Gigaspora margarita]|uniref:RNI-like protein n=1 Tax=Gigaspora margarita TaxID=4874 RepID=A0A8H4ERN8_GIGMA|nr:RNI-like protein [Gigaspora margarita]